MNRFIFLTHVTPVSKRSILRQKLFELHLDSLKNQQYGEWKVIQLGEAPDVQHEKFHHFVLPDASREEKPKLIKALFDDHRFSELLKESDYLVKLDDDDIISPYVLKQLENFSGDLYFDRWHTFADCTSNSITQQERPWVASTCIHRTSHALAAWSGEGASPVGNLLYSDHSKAWHQYYKDKVTQQADPLHPVYLRVLSPTSVTSGLRKSGAEFGSSEREKYYSYLSAFGNWKPAPTKDFDAYRSQMNAAWTAFSGVAPQPLPASVTAEAFAQKMKRLAKSVFGKR